MELLSMVRFFRLSKDDENENRSLAFSHRRKKTSLSSVLILFLSISPPFPSLFLFLAAPSLSLLSHACLRQKSDQEEGVEIKSETRFSIRLFGGQPKKTRPRPPRPRPETMPRKATTTQLPTPLASTLARRFEPVRHSYSERDASLYALAVGAAAPDTAVAVLSLSESSSSSAAAGNASSSSSSSDDLSLVYEGASGFAPLPTFPCTFPYFGVTAAVPCEEILPNFNPVS